ncbi:hypothetical protein M405DRAFT_882634 [Rhizopogon salebrosus TDB-379]|nr:hypothetical protein M405DRAFT_882634 [Rhizopogon salebrosus TDB-379]
MSWTLFLGLGGMCDGPMTAFRDRNSTVGESVEEQSKAEPNGADAEGDVWTEASAIECFGNGAVDARDYLGHPTGLLGPIENALVGGLVRIPRTTKLTPDFINAFGVFVGSVGLREEFQIRKTTPDWGIEDCVSVPMKNRVLYFLG